jgi:Uncharacterized conserved protein
VRIVKIFLYGLLVVLITAAMNEGISVKMRKFAQNKLWRDKAPDLMEQMGSVIHIKSLSDLEYDQELRIKLMEEAQEVVTAKSKKELIEEIADVLEVVDAFCALHGFSKEEIEVIQKKKRDSRGGFYERKFVTIAEHTAGGFGEQYCLAAPEKYPEILD